MCSRKNCLCLAYALHWFYSFDDKTHNPRQRCAHTHLLINGYSMKQLPSIITSLLNLVLESNVVFIHESMHSYKHAFMQACIHTSMHLCKHAFIQACIHARMQECIHASMHSCKHAFMQAGPPLGAPPSPPCPSEIFKIFEKSFKFWGFLRFFGKSSLNSEGFYDFGDLCPSEIFET